MSNTYLLDVLNDNQRYPEINEGQSSTHIDNKIGISPNCISSFTSDQVTKSGSNAIPPIALFNKFQTQKLTGSQIGNYVSWISNQQNGQWQWFTKTQWNEFLSSNNSIFYNALQKPAISSEFNDFINGCDSDKIKLVNQKHPTDSFYRKYTKYISQSALSSDIIDQCYTFLEDIQITPMVLLKANNIPYSNLITKINLLPNISSDYTITYSKDDGKLVITIEIK